jgi:hypothetical protein
MGMTHKMGLFFLHKIFANILFWCDASYLASYARDMPKYARRISQEVLLQFRHEMDGKL